MIETPRQTPPHAGDDAAAALLVLLPLAMWVQSRSAVLFLVLATVATLIARAATGDLGATLRQVRSHLRGPVGLPIIAFVGWAVVSTTWSHRPVTGLWDVAELALPAACGLLLACAWPAHAPRWALRAIATAVLIATLFTLGELALGPGFRMMIGRRTHSFIFNRTTICLLLLIVPTLVVFLVSTPRWIERAWEQKVMRQGMVITLGLFGLCLLYTESGAVRLGAMVTVAAALALWLLPRLTMAAFAAGLVGLVVIGPFQGSLGERLIPPTVHETLKDSHSRDRIDIWLAFGDLIRQRPLIGAGFGSAEAASDHPLAAPIEGRRRVLLDVGHPHSLQVQAWAETGLVGAVLLALAGLAALWKLSIWPPALRAMALATAAGALAIAAVGHGAWQGWWIASIAVSCVLFTLAKRIMDGDFSPSPPENASHKESAA